jgi:hypothetical protein
MYTEAEMKEIRDYIWRVEDGLNTASRDHFWGLGTPCPAEISEEDWQANITAHGASLDRQWQMLRELKAKYGIK